VHHLPAGPPLAARLSAFVRRSVRRLRRVLPTASFRLPARRIALGLAFFGVLTAVVLAVPVVSGAGDEGMPVALDSSSTTSAGRAESEEPVVVMGVDGRSAISSSASRADRGTAASTPAGAATTDQSSAAETSEATGTSSAAGTSSASGTSSTQGTTTAAANTTDRTTTASTPGSPSSPASSSASSPSTSLPPTTTPDSVAPADLESQVVALVAQARSDAGCAASNPDPSLADVGRQHSAEMRGRGAPEALDLAAWAVRGAAVGSGTDPDAVVSRWLADPASRATLLDCGSTALGAGAADAPGGPWVTVVLA
jgi:uncharacterized protein YkwD